MCEGVWRTDEFMCMCFMLVFLVHSCARSGSRLMLSVVMAMAFHLAFSQSLSHRSIPVPIAGSVRLKPRLCPIGLPGDHGVVSGPRDIRRAVCANGHGSGHCLQQCARLRPQHWRRHGSEHHHWCKWGWGTTPTHQPIASDASVYQPIRGSACSLPAAHVMKAVCRHWIDNGMQM